MSQDVDLIIKASLAQAIADYLVLRPYREVAQLVEAISQLAPTATAAPSKQDAPPT